MWQEIAEMPTPHSWAAQIMALDSESMDKEIDKIESWIEETITKEFPQSEKAERIVREVWPLVMEREAIRAYLDQHPFYLYALEGVDVQDAASIGARECLADDADRAIAEKFLEEMQEGTQVPPHVKI